MAEERLNEAEFARLIGVSPGSVNRWLSEDRFPSWGRLMKMAQALHRTTDWLLGMPDAEDAGKRRTSPAVVEAVTVLIQRLDEAGAAAAAVAGLLPRDPAANPKKKR